MFFIGERHLYQFEDIGEPGQASPLHASDTTLWQSEKADLKIGRRSLLGRTHAKGVVAENKASIRKRQQLIRYLISASAPATTYFQGISGRWPILECDIVHKH
jgi:hypothetical protein